MKKNIKRKILGLSLTLLLLNLNIQPVIAAKISFERPGSDDISTPEDGYDEAYDEKYDGSGANEKKIVLSYEYNVKTTSNIYMDAYPNYSDGKSAMPENVSQLNDFKFKAGTWIGIRIVDERFSNWEIQNFEYYEEKYQFQCKYLKAETTTCTRPMVITGISVDVCAYYNGTYDPNKRECKYIEEYSCPSGTNELIIYEVPGYKSYGYTCPSTYNGGTFTEKVSIGEPRKVSVSNYEEKKNEIINELKTKAKNSVTSSSAKVKYIDLSDNSDNYPETDLESYYKELEGTYLNGSIEETMISETKGSFSATIEFLQKKVCMNLKTADVRYGEDCNSEELQIENKTIYDENLDEDITFWHYFIPLNTKSDVEFPIKVEKNDSDNGIISVEDCDNFMQNEKYKESYKYHIIPIGEPVKSFTGTYTDDYELLVDRGGCQINVQLLFKVNQEFYRETKVDDKLKFKGYNFFYKPIDPKTFSKDSVTSPSLWEKWTGSNPNISESFSNITYETEIISGNKAKEVRNYNKIDDHVYTSWQSITTSGTSDFISDENVVIRKNPDSYYKLGCGLANSDSTNKMLFIEGCDVKS